MANTWKKLAQVAITASPATIYTVPAGKTTVLLSVDIANTGGATVAVYLHAVPSAGSAGTNNAIFYNVDVASKGVLSYSGPLVLAEGDFVVVQGSTTGLTITVSGIEVT